MKVPMIEVIKEENQNHELHLLELSTVLMNQRCPGQRSPGQRCPGQRLT